MKIEPLKKQEAHQLGEAVARWYQLRDQAIKTPTSDAEIKGLTEFIANTLMTHAHEFVGCWFTVRDEYEPAINLLARVGTRIDHVRQLMEVARQQAEGTTDGKGPEPEPAPSNIIPVTK